MRPRRAGNRLDASHSGGKAAFVYILRCADGSYYVGFTRRPPDGRLAIHRSGAVKGWSRAKKAALIAGDWDAVKHLARRRGGRPFAAPLSRGTSGR